MINIYEYFSVDWEATSDNIRSKLEGLISSEVFARAMGVTERSIYNWCNNKSHPKIDDFVLMAKFFGCDILDILVLNGEAGDTYDEVSFKEELHDVHLKSQEAVKQLSPDQIERYDCHSVDEFKEHILFHEYITMNYPIKTLEEFLLYFPLFHFEYMKDFLQRAKNNGGKNTHYIYQKLKYMYQHIDNQKAKIYADSYKNYYLKYPKLHEIDDKTKLKAKTQKYNKWEQDFKDKVFHECCDEYNKEYNKMLGFFEMLIDIKNFQDPS